jgi:hypothetical protein
MKKNFSFLAAVLVAAGSLAASLGGCELIASVDRSMIPGTGGAGGGTTTSTSSGGMCMDPTTDCPAPGTVCITVSCGTNATCTNTNAASGTACTDSGGKVCDGMGHCVACNAGADCPMPATACVTPTCSMGACGTSNAAAETTCTDNAGTVCDGSGHCVACVAAADCPAQSTKCITNTCTGNACGTMKAASGTACTDNNGKVCDGNGTCVECNTTADCTGSNICTSNQCVPATCTDHVKDGNETDVDCGGACPGCADAKACMVAGDCLSGFCKTMVCTACAHDADCASGNFCDLSNNGGTCTPTKAVGMACGGSNECTGGNCVDGFCCNTACNGTCTACSNAKKGAGADGVCGNVVAGTDPNNQCPDQGAASCGTNGSCDGNGACADYSNSTVCAAQVCSNGSVTPARMCNGTGTCSAGSPMSCAPYAGCNGNACPTTCSADADCTSGNYCNAQSHCAPAQANGSPCTNGDGNQCTSTFCVDGVCCNNACSGTCSSCALNGSVGMCSNEPSGSNNANHACPSNEVCNGTTGSSAGCVQCVNNTNCSAPNPACNLATNTCVQCTTNANCSAPNPACNTTSNTCVQCTADANCVGNASGPACDTTINHCVQCTATNSTACTGNTPVCDTMGDADNELCVQCNQLSDCPSGMGFTACTAHACM